MNPYWNINQLIKSANNLLDSQSTDNNLKFLTLVLLENAIDKTRSLVSPPPMWKRKLFKSNIERDLNELRKKIGEFSKTIPSEKRRELLAELGRTITTGWLEV